MAGPKDNHALDTSLLCDAIIELTISFRNVSIYPQNHPTVERSLNRAYGFMKKLLELRNEITIAAAKENIIVNEYSLGNQNPVYREFAAVLGGLHISHVTFVDGLTREEMYSFQSFLSKDTRNTSLYDNREELLKGHNLIHVKVEFIDYSVFSFDENQVNENKNEESHLEQYVYGILQGGVKSVETSGIIQNTAPEKLARLINELPVSTIKEDSYDKVIASYLHKSTERTFASEDLNRILEFIENLRPDLKRQFLLSTVNSISTKPDSVKTSLKNMSANSIINLLSVLNEQTIVVPETLRNILGKFSGIHQAISQASPSGAKLIEDDIILSHDAMNILGDDNFKSFVSNSYQSEINRFIHHQTEETDLEIIEEIEKQLVDESLEIDFSRMILELLQSDDQSILWHEDCIHLITTVKQQADQFVSTGMYTPILEIITALKSDIVRSKHPKSVTEALQYFHSQEFLLSLVDSFRIMGREMRDDVTDLCNYFGEEILPPLIDALIDEKSQAMRRFIIGLIVLLGKKNPGEILKRLGDDRWFVKRNILYIMNQCGGNEILRKARPYCTHENPKVSLEALKCLLKARDSYGEKLLRDYLKSKSSDLIKKAINLSGAFKVREIVPDLTRLLRKRVLNRADYELKIPAVQALGQIGDPIALDVLRELLAQKPLLYRSSFQKMKNEIGRTINSLSRKEAGDRERDEGREMMNK